MKINFYDTSAILNLNDFLEGKTYISPLVLAELENIKTANYKDEHQKYLARKAIRLILKNENFLSCFSEVFSQRKIEKIIKQNSFLSNINDHRILCEAVLLQMKYTNDDVHFITGDSGLYLFAQKFSDYITPIYLPEIENKTGEELWTGWGKYYPDENQMTTIYSNRGLNILDAKINEYCIIHEGSNLKDILRWDGNSFKNLSYKSFKSVLGSKIEPRNLEQKMLFDLLQNRNIPIKLCLGRFGSGKSYLMLAHALSLVQKGEFEKIVFVKNNIEVKDTNKIGALPGNELEKLAPFIQQIADHVGQITLDDMLEQNVLEPIHLGFMRGRDIKNSIIFCDEVENMTKQHIQLLIGRVSSGSELWLAGDLKQTDNINFEKNSGIRALIQGLMNEPLFGMVKLIKSERSAVAALADKLD